MSAPASRRYLVIALAIIVAGVLVSASLLLAIRGETKTVTVTTTSYTATTVISVTQPPSVRNLSFDYSGTIESSASVFTMTLTAAETNELSSANNVSAADDWLIPLDMSEVQACWTPSWPVGLAIASGHYTLSNITSAKFLDLVNPGITYSCPLTSFLGYATEFGFAPRSDVATGHGCSVNPCPTAAVSLRVTASGYWSQGSFTSFPRGTYTVLAEDEWGRFDLGSFLVP